MRKVFLAAMGAAMVVAAPAGAQIFTPTYQAPVQGQDIGIYIMDAGDDVGVEGMIRRRFGATTDVGFRVGFAEAGNDGDVLLLGADLRAPLRLAGVEPLSLALTGGIQAALLDADAVGLQGGVSLGYTFAEANFTPYIHPRLALINANDETDLEVEADVGFDWGITDTLVFRLGANLGDGADWGIGLAFRR
jgi:hypothetical protein